MSIALGTLQDFLNDVEPLFYGKRLTYVDVGAFDGSTYKQVFESGLNIREALLLEPNPKTFAELQANLDGFAGAKKAELMNAALSDSAGSLTLKDARSMTKVVDDQQSKVEGDSVFEAPAHRLSDLVSRLSEGRISLLKIDVEGFETQVLQGATSLFDDCLVDMLYVEAGMTPDSKQQTYYRDIDDFMLARGYKLFRIYEQMFEWIEDSPFLRRVNLAYLSPEFAARHPFRLTNELFDLKKTLESRKDEISELRKANVELTKSEASAQQELLVVKKNLEESKQSVSHAVTELESQHEKDKEEWSIQKEAWVAQKEAWTTQKQAWKDKVAKLESRLEDDNEKRSLLRQEVATLSRALKTQHSASLNQRTEFRNEQNKLRASRDALKAELAELKVEHRELRRSWAHRVGRQVVDGAKTPLGVARLPVAMAKMFVDYKKAPPKKSKASPKRGPRTATKVPTASRQTVHPNWPKVMKSAMVWQAASIAQNIGHDSAVAFLRRYGKEPELLAANLFEANRDLSSDEAWLRGVNEYLTQFDALPLQLHPGTTPRFQRISCAPDYTIDDGPLVTVIMPAHNSEDTIEHAMRSVLNQTWKNLRLIVVDDASEDSTWPLIQKLKTEDDRIVALKNVANVGPYVSKNRALDLAEGRFVTGHDADDWAHPQRLERHITAMLADSDVKASLGQMIRVSEEGEFTHFAKIGKTSRDGVLRLASISCMFELETLRTLFGHWDTVRFGADSELIERCRKVLGPRFATFDIFTMVCLDAATSLTNHPVHGVSKQTGISPSRAYYRSQWLEWHQGLDTSNAYLDFPQRPRKFEAPAAALADDSSIDAVLSDSKKATSGGLAVVTSAGAS